MLPSPEYNCVAIGGGGQVEESQKLSTCGFAMNKGW